jgi:Lrp/AsnC family transcriptional regulator for asnA, asnC and gidA
MSYNIDQTDVDIINLLREDGRIQNTDVARRLGVSEATVRKRIARLVQEKVISHYVWAEPLKVGYSHYLTVDIRAEPGEIEAVAQRLAEMQETSFVGICYGNFDVRASLFVRSSEDIHGLLMAINSIKGIRHSVATSFTRIVKRDYNFILSSKKD